MSTDLVARLRHGCVTHPRRWSGDTHDDLGGSIRESETDAVMAEAADEIDTLRAQLEAAERVAQSQAASLMRTIARAEAAEAECAAMRALIARVVSDTQWRSDDNTLWPDLCAAARIKELSA